MRLITISLFAVLLAATAFGQSGDFDPTRSSVGINFFYQEHGPLGPSTVRQCTGVVLDARWVLTAASCSGSGSFFTRVGPDESVPLKAVTHPDRALGAGHAADDLMLLHMACPVNVVADGERELASAARIGEVVPGWSTAFAAEVVRVWSSPRVQGNAFKRAAWAAMTPAHALWRFSSSDEPLSGGDEGAPMYFGEDVVGIYSRDDNGRYTFVDITTKREWITKTMRDETLHIPGLCEQ